MICQRQRERTVPGVAVLRGGARLGGIGDQRVRAGRLDLGEAASDGARCDGPLHDPGKRIVTAGVEDDQPKLLGGLDRHQYAVQRQCLVIDVSVALQSCIYRDQIVGAVHLHAVASVIDHGYIGVARRIREIA